MKLSCVLFQGEIEKLLSLGVDPSRMILAHPTKPLSHISYAKMVGVDAMTFDNEMELQKVASIHPNAQLIVRIKCDDPYIQYKMGKKFGCEHDSEALMLLKRAKELNLNVIGVSFHVGSGVVDANIFHIAIGYAKQVGITDTDIFDTGSITILKSAL